MSSSANIRAGRAYVELGVDDRMAKALDRAGKKLQAFGAQVAKVGLGVQAAGLAVLTPLLASTKVFAEMGDAVNKASDRTGVAVESLSALGYAAKQSGSDLAGLETGLKHMQKALAAAALGGADSVAVLRRLGLGVSDLSGLSPDKQFELIADRLAGITDPAMRAASAMELLGRSGVDLLPLMKGGAAGIRELTGQAERLGLVVSGADAALATEFGDTLDDLWQQLKAITFQLGAAVAGALLPFARSAREALAAVIAWVKENRGLVVAVTAAAAGVVALGGVITGLGIAVQVAGFALAGLGAALAAVISPMGLVVAGAVLAAAALVYFTDVGDKAVGFLKARFAELLSWASDVFAGIRDALAAGDIALAAQILWTALQVAWLRGTQGLYAAWVRFRAGFVQVAAAAFYGALELWENVKASLMTAWETTVAFFGDVWDGFVGYFTDAWNTAVNGVAKAINHVRGLFDDSFDAGAANRALEDQAAADAAERRQAEMDRKSERDAGRDDATARIDRERQAALDDLARREAELSRAATEDADGDLADRKVKLRSLQEQLRQQIQKAKEEREGLAAPEGAKRPEFDPFAAQQAVQDVTKVAAAGTFNAAAVQGLQGNATDEYLRRTAQAAEGCFTQLNAIRFAWGGGKIVEAA